MRGRGFGPKVVRLDGTYGVARGGIVEPALKVELTKTGYVFEERERDEEWKVDPETPHTATAEEVQRGLRVGSPGVPVFGLATAKIMLLKLPAGWRKWERASGAFCGCAARDEGVVTKSGFLIVSGGAMVAAEKVQLGGR